MRHDETRPAISAGRKLARPRVTAPRYRGSSSPTSVAAASLNRRNSARSRSASSPAAVVPPSRPVAGSKLAFFELPRIAGVYSFDSPGSRENDSSGRNSTFPLSMPPAESCTTAVEAGPLQVVYARYISFSQGDIK